MIGAFAPQEPGTSFSSRYSLQKLLVISPYFRDWLNRNHVSLNAILILLS